MNTRVALYGHWICPYVTRVRFALAQRGIEHALIDVPPSSIRGRDFVLPSEFVEHSPRLEIPMVRVDDDYLADSIPILEWLEQRISAPSLLPDSDAERGVVRERMTWIDRHVFPAMVGVYYGVDPAAIERASADLARALAHVATWSAPTGWLVGIEPSLADAVVIPLHVRMAGLRRLGFRHELPHDWLDHGERCRALAGWPAIAWSDAQTDEFVLRFEAFRRKRRARQVS